MDAAFSDQDRRSQTDRLPLAPGTRISHYEIIRTLGMGGMGEVYLAQDTLLRRKVAIKVLTAELSGDERALRRFEQEAQAVSALNHPNILTIYEFGQFDTSCFFVTEFVQGNTLREKIAQGPLQLEAAVEIAIQIASALAAAHSFGIIHRDIKPDNVIVRDDGVVKVLDFGIAKLSEGNQSMLQSRTALSTVTANTQAGMVIGTAKYMSPEQARGVVVDGRTDVFSLGAVMYEMLTAKAAFDGETRSDIIAEILKGAPPPIAECVPGVPAELERIINTALQKDRERRYHSAKDLLLALQAFKSEAEFQAKLHKSQPITAGTPVQTQTLETHTAVQVDTSQWRTYIRSTRGKKTAAAAALLLVLACVAGYFALRKPSANPHTKLRTVAILPFRNLRPDPETNFLGFSLADAVITKLGYVSALNVRPSSAIDKYRNEAIDPEKVAAELKVDDLLTGSYVKEGNDLRITTQLINAKEDNVIWNDTIDVKYENLLSVQDRVAQEILRGLEVKLTPSESKHLKADQPVNVRAYEYYLRGVDLYALDDYAASIEMLQKSLSIEPNYAPAWAHLGRAYTTNASLRFGGREQYAKAQEAYERALELDPALVEPRVYMANLLTDTGRVEQAVPLLREALKTTPNDAEAHWELGYAYRFAGMLKQSIEECEKGRQFDPSVKINSSALNSYLYVGAYDKFLDSLPINNSPYILFYRGFAEYYKRNYKEAANNFDRAYELAPSLLPAEIGKALSYAIRHDNASGLKLLHETEAQIDQHGVSDAEGIYKLAQAYAVLGDKASALRVLRRSIDDGFFCYSYFISDPLMASLRAEPEFQALMKRAKQRHEQFQKRFFG